MADDFLYSPHLSAWQCMETVRRDLLLISFNFLFQLENKLLQFHLGNLEFSCAAPLSKVSLLSWDQNEAFPQFSGDHTLLQHGFGALLNNLAQNLDIMLQYEVRPHYIHVHTS